MQRPAGRPTRLLLVRHGQVEGSGGLHGHVDVPLTAAGRAQMEVLAERLAAEPGAAIYCSDLRRTRDGAELLATRWKVPVHQDPAFRELSMGRWEGRPVSELWEKERASIEEWWRDVAGFTLPGGENLADLQARVLPALRCALAEHSGETVCLVAHGGVNRLILFDALGLPLTRYYRLAQDYGCLNVIEYYPEGDPVVKLVNG